MDVKIKAGRIVPAFATTTAIIAGIQTIELVKILLNRKRDCKNSFINLAIPFFSMIEPAPKMIRNLSKVLAAS